MLPPEGHISKLLDGEYVESEVFLSQFSLYICLLFVALGALRITVSPYGT